MADPVDSDSAAEQDAFLRAVLAAPEDDAPRLVFADWLDEHGETDRAEFIRIQCSLAWLPTDDPRRAELKAQESALWAEHGYAWAPVQGRYSPLVFGLSFARGYPDLVRMAPTLFQAAGGHVLRTHPTVRTVAFDAAVPRDLLDLAQSESLARVPKVDFYLSSIGDTGCSLLARDSLWLGRVRSLCLSANCISDSGVEALVGAGALSCGCARPCLEELDLSRNRLTLAGVRRIADSPVAYSLKRLSLRANLLGDDAAEFLLETPALRGVEVLDLSENRLSEAIREALVRTRPRWVVGAMN
jgi:uncharacterized protein (TIGR02996 family)